MCKVSIIIPAYNSEKYIEQTIQSILNQSISEWELIVVDDCSNDKTLHISKSYANQDSRIRIIERKNNSGSPRIPRFDGILHARGTYVCPVDSDDFLAQNYLELLLNKQVATNADIVLGRIVYTSKEGEIQKYRTVPSTGVDFEDILSGREACSLTIGGWKISLNGLLTKTSLYKKFVESRYTESPHSGFADEVDYRYLLLNMESVSVCGDAHYYYRQHDNSIVHHLSRIQDRMVATSSLLNFVNETYMDDEHVKRAIHSEYMETCYRLMCRFVSDKKKLTHERKLELWRGLKSFYNRIKQEKMQAPSLKYRLICFSYLSLVLAALIQNLYAGIKS